MYYNFGIWCDINNLFGQAAYFHHRSNEERDHAKWIIDYLTQADYLFSIPGTDARYIDIYKGRVEGAAAQFCRRFGKICVSGRSRPNQMAFTDFCKTLYAIDMRE